MIPTETDRTARTLRTTRRQPAIPTQSTNEARPYQHIPGTLQAITSLFYTSRGSQGATIYLMDYRTIGIEGREGEARE